MILLNWDRGFLITLPTHIMRTLQIAAKDPQIHKYSLLRGLPKLKEDLCELYLKQYCVDLDPEKEVAILSGMKTGLPKCQCNCLIGNLSSK
ncbi:aminotransferase class I/II-fold pyridoxal phosphate-dependent enzyme [Niallia oryzisoli]|uniref:aminotransferase class I/II-fold pyridoxal phosphate-dependent enzyme n=1 Tax=Niallia oryzisoli TaxID=1737571 RepID=UPI003BB12ED0